jgi:hypothetical protein
MVKNVLQEFMKGFVASRDSANQAILLCELMKTPETLKMLPKEDQQALVDFLEKIIKGEDISNGVAVKVIQLLGVLDSVGVEKAGDAILEIGYTCNDILRQCVCECQRAGLRLNIPMNLSDSFELLLETLPHFTDTRVLPVSDQMVRIEEMAARHGVPVYHQHA